MRINNNLMAINTHRQLGMTGTQSAKSMEKLSSGLRINRAGDDAAGLAISEKMRGQIRGLNQASRNAQDGISLIQTAEGALQETQAMVQRMRELAVQSNNNTNTGDDLTEIQKEITQLVSEIDRVGDKTEFNTKKLLNGSLGSKAASGTVSVASFTAAGVSIDTSGLKGGSTVSFVVSGSTLTARDAANGINQTLVTSGAGTVNAGSVLNFDKIGLKLTFSANTNLTTGVNVGTKTIKATGTQISFQIGANENTVLSISIDSMKTDALGLGTGNANVTKLSEVNVTNKDFNENIKVIDKAIKDISAQRSQLGAWQNRLEYTIKNLDNSAENLQAAESRVRDVDMAKEMMNFSKNNILQQAAQAMLAQANQAPQGVLQLLR